MGAAIVIPRVRISRAAVFGVFTLNGFLCAMWVVHIPVITQRTGVSKGTLGLLILLVALGGIAGMQAAGPLADRFGSRTLVAAAGVWISLAVLGPAFAIGPLTLAIALLLFGTGNGALDVSMNAQAVQVERAYRRPIMSAFHAMFSCGGLAGSLVGAATMHHGWDVRVTMTGAGVIGLLSLAVFIPRLLPISESDFGTTASGSDATDSGATGFDVRATGSSATRSDTGTIESCSNTIEYCSSAIRPDAETTNSRPGTTDSCSSATGSDPVATKPGSEASGSTRNATEPSHTAARRSAADRASPERRVRRTRRLHVLALAAIAFAFLLTEGVANDWSALQVREHLRVSDATAALAFGAFSTTMTVGRFATDRVSGRFGRVAVVRWGAILAAAGLTLIVCSVWLPPTLSGWALLGIGLAGGVPQIFSAAGNLGGSSAATDMSRVFGLGYLGFLAGPSVIGWLADLSSLTVALLFPLALILVCAACARIVAPSS
ncbi:MFS transporter [Nocardia macrotermitis]|uniref:Major facilitator superfamily (MFS) profile domain-containing protein n=1 Tax=Nocardia macrotermitis TaxID=2585198 RepID=A0A7K0DEX2_9NOCA|nr:MFS transporter [Nocardia macrotermitis]MQY23394.1 hypothetical protein [Nocardia macrotermitis]